MNDPTAQARSGYAQSHGMKKTGKAKFKQGKALQSKAAGINKAVVLHFILFLLCGILLGAVVFIPFYSADYSVLKILFGAFFGLGFLIGAWHLSRMNNKIDWAPGAKFFPKFLLALCVNIAVFGGILLSLYFLPRLLSQASETNLGISAILASGTISVLIPFLLNACFEQALKIEEKSYRFWEYPENYIEKQPTWNRERVIFSNLNFRRKQNENFVTTIKVKLPKEANFGELIYLFMKDYNENRSPEKPIDGLSRKQGTLGWFFKTDNRGASKIWKRKRLIDTDMTIEENGIEEDGHIYFERIQMRD